MDIFSGLKDCKDDSEANSPQDSKTIIVQLLISLALGLSSFIAFCVSIVHIQLFSQVLIFARYYDHDGNHYMRLESSGPMLPRPYQSYRIHSLDGYRCFIKSPSSRFLRLLAWMLMSYVIRSILY